MGQLREREPAAAPCRRRAGRWLVVLLLVLLLAQAGGPAAAGTGGTGAGPGRAGGLVFDSVHVVVRWEPEDRGLGALVLVRARNAGRETLQRVPLPWLEGAELLGSPEAPAPVVEDGRLFDGRPLPPGTERRYTYQVRVDSRATRGRLLLLPPAPVERFYLFTRDGELVARSDQLADGGAVDGERAGVPGVRLRLYEGGPLPPGVALEIALLPAGMPGVPGNGGGDTPGDGAGSGASGSSGGPAPAPPAGRAASGPGGARAGLWIGWLVALAAGAGLLALASRRRRAGAGELLRRRQALIREIVALDRAYAAGEIEPGLYAQERDRLRRAAVELTVQLRERDGYAAGPRAGGAGPAGEEAPAGPGREAPAR